MLTKHQQLHLDAVIAECDENKLVSAEQQTKLAAAKNVKSEDYDTYLTTVKTAAQNIIDSGVFPEGLEPSDIHDYLENNG